MEQLRECLKDLIQKKPTLVTSLDLADTSIINAALIVQGIYNGTTRRIVLGGTSKTVSLGRTVCVIAGKVENTIILEIHARKENIDLLPEESPYQFGQILNGVYAVRTTEKSLYGLTEKVHPVRVLGGTYSLDPDGLLVFLELKPMGTE